ncbi:hypothetical protein [Mucilaginibacter boryungensis]|uniref:T9SS C-terminal target domain-containing protein n=1 Tax=Mucilaginibacter boryungensis TaxID=768480 RepID=A0ABR9XHG5_9SPHI|nr:hypothetical protein [Mucilaginibacter boryungensis]MBE9666828.1 hypothetical protein [Mucilaginibacter boryungensis]
MKTTFLLPILAAAVLFSCKKDSLSLTNNDSQLDTLQGTISTNTTLSANKNYFLKGKVYVKNNATLSIPAGVTVFAQVNELADNKSALIITRGAKINIAGTADNPVVFTSAATNKKQGDWGAIIILGNAPTNVGTGHVEGLPVSNDTQYGGSVATDNSGSINYLRIEYSGGINPPAEDEWIVDKASGLCLAGVGSGTQIDNVMVSHSNDDGFQFVGGTVNATHLIAFNNGDDDFDFDLGYEGNLQFLIAYRTQASSQALRANGLESYNDEVPTTNTPLTRPVISNMTIIGPQGTESVKTNINQGVYMRKGTRLAIRNSIVAEYSQGAFMVCPRTRPAILNNDWAEFRYNLVQSDNSDRTFSYDTSTSIIPDPELATFETNSVNNNVLLIAMADFKLTGTYSAVPDLTPATGSPALSGANFTGVDFSSAFFVKTTYRGAVGSSNWAAANNWATWK